MPLVVHSLEGGHTPQSINSDFKKPGVYKGWYAPGLITIIHLLTIQIFLLLENAIN